MHTGMERNICLTQLRKGAFPSDWESRVGRAFPMLQGLIQSMVAVKPSDRPTAASVARHIESILSEFTLVSLDESKHQGPGMILLRVEARHRADALGETLQAIHDLSSDVRVVQYGLRTSSLDERPTAIMEFAIKSVGLPIGSDLVRELQIRPDIYKVRQVSTGNKVSS
jgi:hypothetical protein